MTLAPVPDGAAPSPRSLDQRLGVAESALCALAEVSAAEVEGVACGEAVLRLLRLQRQLDGILIGFAERYRGSGDYAADGARSMSAWIRGRTHDGLGPARRLEELSRDAARTPLFAEAMTAGEVSVRHLRVVVEAHDRFPRLSAALSQIEPVLLDYARAHEPAELARRLFTTLQRIDPDAVDDAEAGRRGREAALHVTTLLDGWVRIDGMLPPELGASLQSALASASEAVRRERNREPAPTQEDVLTQEDALTEEDALTGEQVPVEPVGRDLPPALQEQQSRRSLCQLDALARVLIAACHATGDGRLPDLAGGRPVIHVHVPLEAFLAAGGCTEPALVAPAGQAPTVPISTAVLRRLSCDATIRRLLVDPRGRVLEYGEATRTVSAGMRTRIVLRDQRCRFTGCRHRIDEVHHVVHAAEGGPTTPSNLVGLCYFHHRQVHEGRWRLSGNAEGPLTLTSHDGRRCWRC